MLVIAARRLLLLVPMMFMVTLIVFGLLMIIPGDPASAVLGDQATPEQIAVTRERMGLNDPVHVRYFNWLGGAVRGDLGTSLFNTYPVTRAITDRLSVTLSLVCVSLVLTVCIGIPAGVIAAIYRGRLLDRLLTIGTSAGIAIPNFWLAVLLALIVGLKLDWLPATGYVAISTSFTGWLEHITLPAITLATASAAELSRQMRSSMVEVLEQDYIRTARSKGLTEARVMLRHAFKNAMIPVITVAGLAVSRTFGLSVIVEQVFAMQGVGTLAVHAVFDRDIPVIQGVVLIATSVVLVTNLAVDLSYLYLNPSTRTS